MKEKNTTVKGPRTQGWANEGKAERETKSWGRKFCGEVWERGGAGTLALRAEWQPKGYKRLVEPGRESCLKPRTGTQAQVCRPQQLQCWKVATPRPPGEIRPRMPRLFLFHLLGVCLLLNQFSRAVAAKWMDDVIKACGRELVRAQIAICGKSTLGKRSLNQEDAPLKPRPAAGESSRPPWPFCASHWLFSGGRPIGTAACSSDSRSHWLPVLSSYSTVGGS